MRITTDQLCSSCRKIHPIMNDGKPFEYSIGEQLGSKGYTGSGYLFMNNFILHDLRNNGGCPRCIDLLECACR